MKKYKFFVTTILILLIFTGCGARTKLHKESASATNKSSESRFPAKLIVNGKDITEGNYVYIDVEKEQAEVPLLAILHELGVEISWIDENAVEISTDDVSFQIDKRDKDFGYEIPPGGGRKVRKAVEHDLIFDDQSIMPILRELTNSYISVDFENLKVEVYQ